MVQPFHDIVDRLLGLSLDANELGFRHMALRSVIVFVFAVMLARLGARRFLAHNAGFDIMVAIILGSVLSRGINGQSAFFPTLGASAVLVALHAVMASMAFRWHGFSQLVKGRPTVLLKDGKIDRRGLAQCKITDHDLEENLRLHGNTCDPSKIAEARLERNGEVSVVKKEAE
jgi:uncharacterized membrane protein YcaP (DUF421 family)